MKTTFISLPLRSSPTRRSISQRAAQLAQAYATNQPVHDPIDPMLAKASREYQANAPPQRNPLAKQLFPSSSPSAPSADIRDQFKKSASTGSAAPVSARTAEQQVHRPLDTQVTNSVTSTSRTHTGNGSLASLYEKSASSNHRTATVDLTSSRTTVKMDTFGFDDDFDDDDIPEIDYDNLMPIPPKPSTAIAKENIPPPSSGRLEWSSSPVSHYMPPGPKRSESATSSGTTSSLKRDLDHESVPEPAQKKPKKRVLPASFRQERAQPIVEVATAITKTPETKSRHFWEQSVSAVKEQKKQLKIQRQPSTAEVDSGVSQEEMDIVNAQTAAKSVAISLSAEQKHVLDLVVNKGQSVFFTGPAGTGKSVLMRAIINDLKKKYAKDPERVAVTASTGLAACNIGGITLHSYSGIGLGKEDAPSLVKKVRRNPVARQRWLKTKCLIIDEVSMVDGELFDKLSQIGRTIRNNGRPWGGIQLIITGDFFQLPPVPDHSQKRETKFAFDSATWDTSIDHTIGLTQVFRQRDPQFAGMLNEMRLGRISPETEKAFKALSRPLTFDDGVDLAELFPTRAQVDGSNEKRLRDLKGKVYKYEAMDVGDPTSKDRLLANMMAPKTLDLKINAQVMLIKNLDETLVNGSLGKVIAFSDSNMFDLANPNDPDDGLEDKMARARSKLKAFSRDPDEHDGQKFPVVQFRATDGTSRVVICEPMEWKVELPNGEIQAKRSQVPLILAWALSIHKAQGQTLERVTVNLGRVFEKGQAYVALSRATSQHGLRVLNFDKNKVMAHPRVVAFYNKLYSAEEAAGRRPSTIADFVSNRKGALPPPQRPEAKVISLLDEEEEIMASYAN